MTETSKEYAASLFELSEEDGNTEEVLSGLSAVSDVFAQTPGLSEFLRSPGISKSVRIKALFDAFSDSVPETVLSFLAVLCEHDGIPMLNDCIEAYRVIYDNRKKHLRAAVKSAVPLTDGEKAALEKKLVSLTGRDVDLEYEVDPSLIGGVTVSMDGMIIDGSLKRRLHDIKEVMDE